MQCAQAEVTTDEATAVASRNTDIIDAHCEGDVNF